MWVMHHLKQISVSVVEPSTFQTIHHHNRQAKHGQSIRSYTNITKTLEIVMAGIVIVGVPLLIGTVAGPVIDLSLLGYHSTTFRDIGMAHAYTTLAVAVLIGGEIAYARLFPREPSAENALDGWYRISIIALLSGYTTSIALTALIWFPWQAVKR